MHRKLIKLLTLDWRKTVAAVLLPGFLFMLVTGLVRLTVYDLPIARGNYAFAGQSWTQFRHAHELEAASKNPFTGEQDKDNALAAIRAIYAYVDWSCGDRFEPLYNQARLAYYAAIEPDAPKGPAPPGDQARAQLKRAFAAACDQESGEVRSRYRYLASDLQVLMGNTFDHEEKLPDAIPFYQAALQPGLNPDNLTAAYNIERQPKSTSGKNNKDKPQPQSSSGGTPKGKL